MIKFNKMLGIFLLLAMALSILGCATPAPTATPTVKPTVKPTVTPTPTVKPTVTPTPTPTPTPTATTTQKPVTLRYASWGQSRSFTQPSEWWINEIAKKTNGLLKVEYYWGGVLSTAANTPDGLKDGLFDMSLVSPSNHPSKSPLYTVVELPALSPRSARAIANWLQYMVEQPINVNYMRDKWNIMAVGQSLTLGYNYGGNKPLRTVEDLKGLRARLPVATGAFLAENFGLVNTQMAGTEYIPALQKGTLDATFQSLNSFTDWKVWEVTKYTVLGLDLLTSGNALLVNYQYWQNLPAAIKQAAKDLEKEHFEKTIVLTLQANATALEMVKKYTEVTTFPATEKAKIVEKAESAYEGWIKEMETTYGIKDARSYFNDMRKKAQELDKLYPQEW